MDTVTLRLGPVPGARNKLLLQNGDLPSSKDVRSGLLPDTGNWNLALSTGSSWDCDAESGRWVSVCAEGGGGAGEARASLEAQWQRACLSMQETRETRVRSLI